MSVQSVNNWVAEFFISREKIKANHIHEKRDLDLFESGLVDSLGIVELIGEIESNFNVELSADDLEDPRFRTINGITEIIEGYIR
jgi:D-alanine--poly(phosphoribitol) ligase subunit 2